MLNFSLEPVPHDEAAKLIADKPAVTKEVFDRLPAELQARSFTITGIEDFDVLAAVRDRIAELPEGADWEKVKKDVIADISPWFNPIAAEKRAELLMRHHAFTAYAAAQAREMDELMDVFPYRQYISTEDSRVRASHAALNGIVLPADHKFWASHTPPWEWNCRCDVVELTAEDAEDERQRDSGRAADAQRVLSGPALKQLENENRLVRGLGVNVDLRTPKQKGGNFEINVRDLNMNYEEIQKRWDPKTRQDFEDWAEDVDIDDDFSLLGWLKGKLPKVKGKRRKGKVGVTPPEGTESPFAPPVIEPPINKSPEVNLPVRNSPVSKALKIGYKRKAHVNKITESINAIDQVHDDGALHELPIVGSTGKNTLGVYTRQQSGKGVSIAVKSTAPHVRMTTVHEIGHFLDHQGIGKPNYMESERGDKGLFAGVLKALDNTVSIKFLKTGSLPADHSEYLLRKREQWARAYAQYVAVKSKDKELLKELAEMRKHTAWNVWDDDDFEPVKVEIDAMFKKLGWNPIK